jgi:hypothetical protein
MSLLKNLDDLDANGKIGDWCFQNNDELIAIRYGADAFIQTIIIPISENTMQGKPHWKWNGNKDLPTITPSILVKDYPGWNAGWHGFLTDGKLITV